MCAHRVENLSIYISAKNWYCLKVIWQNCSALYNWRCDPFCSSFVYIYTSCVYSCLHFESASCGDQWRRRRRPSRPIEITAIRDFTLGLVRVSCLAIPIAICLRFAYLAVPWRLRGKGPTPFAANITNSNWHCVRFGSAVALLLISFYFYFFFRYICVFVTSFQRHNYSNGFHADNRIVVPPLLSFALSSGSVCAGFVPFNCEDLGLGLGASLRALHGCNVALLACVFERMY